MVVELRRVETVFQGYLTVLAATFSVSRSASGGETFAVQIQDPKLPPDRFDRPH